MWCKIFMSFVFCLFVFLFVFFFAFFLKFGFAPSKDEQPLQDMELQKKKKRLKQTGNLFRKNLQLIGIC